MNYRTPAEDPPQGKVVYAGAPRGRLLRYGFTVALVGLGVFCALIWYGVRLSCARRDPDDLGQCSLLDPALAAYEQFPAHPDAVTAPDVENDDTTHVELSVPGHSTATVSARNAKDTAQAYAAFVADRGMRTLDRRVPGAPWPLLVVVLPLLFFVVSLRRAERSRRVLVDAEGDQMVVEELDVRGAQKKVHRFRLSTIETTTIEAVEDSDAYELVASQGPAKRPLYRSTDEECRTLKPIVDQAIERAKALRS